jgi:hypothetical protein
MSSQRQTDLKNKEAMLEKNGVLLPEEGATIGPPTEASRSRIRHGQESEAFEAFTQRFKSA